MLLFLVLNRYLEKAAGVSTLFDVRRNESYDAAKTVDRYLNLPEVKAAMGAHPGVSVMRNVNG